MKNLIDLLPMGAAPEVNSGDYLKDGLLYCGHCDTAKQCRVKLGDMVRIVTCLCACGERKRDANEKAEADRQLALFIRNLRASGIADRSLQNCRFDDSEMTPELRKCKKYADGWNRAASENSGLLLWGNTGTGKTYSAACIANALIDKGVPVMITSLPRILNSGYDKTDLVKQLQYYPLLILDDLGAERNSDYAMETVYFVVDERYKAKKPLIVTTNLTLDELCKPKNMDYQRIYDRVLEMCVPVVFCGGSRRRDIANAKKRHARELLGG